MKKLIAIAVALVMCLSLLPVVALAEGEYYVAGVGALCTSEWDAGDFANQMTANNDGTYSRVYSGVVPGTYEFKVTNGTWDTSWPGENYRFEITAACDVTITFNPADGSVVASGDNLVIPAPSSTFDSITVAGTGSLCGSEWNTGDAANNMTANGAVYTITYSSVAAGEHKFKFAANGSWNDNWGLPSGTALELGTAMDAVYNSQDIVLNLTAASDVTITLDLSAYDGGSKSGAKFTVTVGAAGSAPVAPAPGGDAAPADGTYIIAGTAGLCGTEWDTTNTMNTMIKKDDGTFSFTYVDVAAGNYEFKVTDGTWDNAWPSENYKFGVSATCDVTVTFDPATGSVTATGANVGEPSEGNPGGSTGDSGDTVTMYAHVPETWTEVRAWVWVRDAGGADTPVFSCGWPGEAMTKGDNGWYSIEIPANVNYVIVNNGSGVQTADLEKNDAGDCWVVVNIVDGAVDAKVHASEPGAEDLVPPTQAPTTQAPTQAPTTQAPTTQAPTTQAPTQPAPAEPAGVDTTTIIIGAVLILAAGVVGFVVTKAIIRKKQ